MFRLKIVVFISIFICIPGQNGSSSCDHNKIQVCMKPITDLRHKLNITSDITYVPVYRLDDHQLDQYCSHGQNALSCLKLTGCESHKTGLFQGFDDLLDYLCLKTLRYYKSYQSCYAKETVVRGLEKCYNEVSMALKANDEKHQLCRIVNSDYSCIRIAVEGQCGSKAADWHVTYIKKIVIPKLDGVDCERTKKWTIGTIVAVVALLALGVAISVCFMGYVIRSENRQMEHNTANQFHNVLSREHDERI